MQLRDGRKGGKYGGRDRKREREEKGKQREVGKREGEREGAFTSFLEIKCFLKNYLRRIGPLPVATVMGSGWPVWPLQAHHHPDRG